MPKYLGRVSYKPEGVRGLIRETATRRRSYISKLMENAGGRLEAFYFAFGEDDAFVIFEAPDNASVASVSVAVNASGSVALRIVPLLTAEEMDKALAKTHDYRAPGG